MPTFRNIIVELHSQFDIEVIPEYFPRPQSHYDERGITARPPALVDEEASTCSVYVPVLPGSQFWISYHIEPPVPDEQLFVFKLFINGAHIVTWSAGKEEKWRGKTMFGLYKSKEGGGNEGRAEKRALFFTPPEQGKIWNDVADVFDPDAFIEVRIYRASGRQRVARELQEYTKTPHPVFKRGIDLIHAGRAGGSQPKRYYKFALIDPIDTPFTRFRFYYRTWEQLQNIDVFGYRGDRKKDDDTEAELPVIEPGTELGEEGMMESRVVPSGRVGDAAAGVIHQDNKTLDCLSSGGHAPDHDTVRHDIGNDVSTSKQPYSILPFQLPMPPSLRLEPPRPPSRPLPSIPRKNDRPLSTAHIPHPASPRKKSIMDPAYRKESTEERPSVVETPTTSTSSTISSFVCTMTAMAAATGRWMRRGSSTDRQDKRATSRSMTR
ncbi:hypothetical protein BU24DRAFT_469180 [Aaosphaeria arxii CBS 175.79]|uniref:DUF7918 domain-containing protein n=1 Tax=Aaosphaeria arxii CBS 175.79 TaxID=1450172 RepID=A0A6A5Y4D4_9PLEO|nr:uncharacterized protein BU24DRAFT_469180 [Aaosphaeria arxii CBS 175.79]KAF2020412.1 hypothetical protein BU24DRAFT_469180 [Aaosphaeria arxii CBS 175.79]